MQSLTMQNRRSENTIFDNLTGACHFDFALDFCNPRFKLGDILG